ncbi:hypothetical protein [Streptomyces sp. NPDC088923]|uniref:hypothetical protein n=1 Tax=Streptomyces sp. NPDC088923 TaxID=3365913 RepID=UPI00382EA40C
MSTARAALYSAVMSGQQHSPDNSERASALLDAFAAEVRTEALRPVLDLCDRAERQATRWENPLAVPGWVPAVRDAAAEPAPVLLTEAQQTPAYTKETGR